MDGIDNTKVKFIVYIEMAREVNFKLLETDRKKTETKLL